MLDTNACIALIKNDPAPVRYRFNREVRSGFRIFTSSVAAFELFYGIAKSARRHTNDRSVTALLSGLSAIKAFDEVDARVAGQVRADLESAGTPIGMYDLLIAAQALRYELTLVTANEREFRRIKGLRVENWAF
jgi:tRNA(fMet)-specific endonuclease VapC